VGHFVDAQEKEHVFIVNRNPFEPAVALFSFGTEAVEECSPRDATWSKLGLKDGTKAELCFQPGEGRLFRFTRQIVTPAP